MQDINLCSTKVDLRCFATSERKSLLFKNEFNIKWSGFEQEDVTKHYNNVS